MASANPTAPLKPPNQITPISRQLERYPQFRSTGVARKSAAARTPWTMPYSRQRFATSRSGDVDEDEEEEEEEDEDEWYWSSNSPSLPP